MVKRSSFLALQLAATCLAASNVNIAELLGALSPLKDWPPSDWIQDTLPTGTTPPSSSSTASSGRAKPTAGQTWNIQLKNVPPASAADNDAYSTWDFDMAAANSSIIDAFHAKGRYVICYFSAGSVENYRDDAGDFLSVAIGKVMDGWPDEKWVDVRNQGVRDVMKKRISEAKSKGCDGVDPDNIDGYQNESGFDLTLDDAVDFVRFLAQTAHDIGLTYGLKNGGEIVDKVVDVSDWDINEECVNYQECDAYRPFIAANKPVLHIEYPDDSPKLSIEEFKKKSCSDSDAKGFSTIIKDRDLGEYTLVC